MKSYTFLVAALILPALCIHTDIKAQNPIVQTCYTSDPAPLVVGDTLFLYTGHDEDDAPEERYLMRDYRLFSTTDMVNWTDRGTPLKTTDFVWSNGDANAAQCVYRNGKYYWYVSITAKASVDGGVAVGVAVSDSPTGPFVDPLGKPMITNSQTKFAKHSWDDLDPTVFIDDDGQAYMYWGNNACYWVRLNEDMISYDGEIHSFDIFDKAQFGPDYEEGPWVYKRGGLYYLHYPSGIPETLIYTVSDSPVGPWRYQGVTMEHKGKSGTNHPGIIDYKGNSYFFYHNDGLPGCHDKRRAVCVEQFEYNADGTIPTLTMTEGITEPVGTLDPRRRVEAETIAWSEGLKTTETKERGVWVTSIDNGDFLEVRGVDFGRKAAKNIEVCAKGIAGGMIEVRLDSKEGKTIGRIPIAANGNWTTVKASLAKTKGLHDIYFVFTGTDSNMFELDWWQFK